MNLHDPKNTRPLIERCAKNDRRAQQELFRISYSYAMSICLRFSTSHEEAQEILNDGFLKVFNQLNKYDKERSFGGWLRKIMVNTAIDRYRRNRNKEKYSDIEMANATACSSDIIAELNAEDVLAAVQELPPAYRIVFLLHSVEGYTHPEIADQLGITEGTSKSNLSKARYKLQQRLSKNYEKMTNTHE